MAPILFFFFVVVCMTLLLTMKWNEEEDKKKPLRLLCKRYSSVSLPLSLSASSAPTLLLYLYAHTHTQNTLWQKVCPSVKKERVVFVLGFRVSFTNSREKNAKKFCVCSFLFRVWAHPLPKKRSPLFSFFLRFWSSKKKSFRRWDARKEALIISLSPRFPHFLLNIVFYDGSLFFDSGSAREQSRFCKQGTR